MTLRQLLRESAAMAWASKVSTILICVVVGAMCVAAIATVGQSAAAAATVAAQLEAAGARHLSVLDTKREGFVNERTLGVVTQLSSVTSVTGLGAPADVVNGAVGRGGVRVPLWPVLTNVEAVGTIVQGRAPQAGEAVVTRDAMAKLGMTVPAGFVTTMDGLSRYPVVGLVEPGPTFADVHGGILVYDPSTLGRELRAGIVSVDSAPATVSAILGILRPDDPLGVQVDSPTSLAETAQQLNAQMRSFGRTLLVLIMVIGGFFVTSVVFSDVLIRRRDIGRRRTLGATRSDLIGLVVGRVSLAALAGAGVGCLAGWLANALQGQQTPPAFVAAIGVLAVLVAAITAVPPALFAVTRDPVRVMRTP